MPNLTVYDIAQRYLGIKEYPGNKHHPFIQWCFLLCEYPESTPDETPWCSAFLQHPCWELRLPRSKSAAARSWLRVGIPQTRETSQPCQNDIVVLKRGKAPQPGPEVTSGAAGHAGVLAGWDGEQVLVLGGNQSDGVSIARFPASDVLGIRRLL